MVRSVLTTARLTNAEHAEASGRSSAFALLTATEPGRRNRRTIDSVFLALATLALGLSAAIASSAPEEDESVADALTTIFGWAGPLWPCLFIGVLVLAALIVAEVIRQRRWGLARDVLLAILVVVGAATVLARAVVSDWFPVEPHILSNWGYPELRLATATAVIVVVGPELVRSVRVLAIWLIPTSAVGAVVIGAALPSAMLGALGLAIGAGAVVRLAFGTAEGFPLSDDVTRALSSLG